MEPSNLRSQISHLTSQNYAIIVAGGSGTRMQTTLPKQFLLLNGKPVLMHTLEAFHQSETRPQLIVVLHPSYHKYWKTLCAEHSFGIPHQLVSSGETRFHSVKNGLELVEDGEDILVAIHDAVRPLTGKQIIDASYHHAAINGNAVTAVKSRDSIRQLRHGVTNSLIRDEIYLVQTPQTFSIKQLKAAYLQPYDPCFTDDASVVEKTGYNIHLTEGSYENIKITFPEDIIIAEALLKEKRDR